MQELNRPFVGVGVLILKDGKILLSQRKGEYGRDTWSPPGGNLEYNEDVFDCAKRETLEETGIEIENLQKGPYINDHNAPNNKHYITLYVKADYKSGNPRIMEPEKSGEWHWFSWNALPSPLFYPFQNFINHKYSLDSF